MTSLHRLLVRAACSPVASVAGESFRSWRGQADPMLVENTSCDLFGLLDHNLTRHGISFEEHERWTGVRRRNWVHQSMILGAFRAVMAGLVTRVGPVFLMDCAAVMAHLPEPSGWRLFFTPGVCVPRERLADALDVLKHAGWSRSRAGVPRAAVLETSSSILLEKPGHPRLRLHWRFFPHAGLEPVEMLLREGMIQAPGYAVGCMVPDPAAVLLASLWQVQVHAPENPLIPLVDSARLIEQNSAALCWEKVPGIVSATNTSREIGSVLHNIHEIAGMPLPDVLHGLARESHGHFPETAPSMFGAYWQAFCEWRRFHKLKPQSPLGFREYASNVRGLEVSLRNALRRMGSRGGL